MQSTDQDFRLAITLCRRVAVVGSPVFKLDRQVHGSERSHA